MGNYIRFTGGEPSYDVVPHGEFTLRSFMRESPKTIGSILLTACETPNARLRSEANPSTDDLRKLHAMVEPDDLLAQI